MHTTAENKTPAKKHQRQPDALDQDDEAAASGVNIASAVSNPDLTVRARAFDRVDQDFVKGIH
jgi:hypothetical protein